MNEKSKVPASVGSDNNYGIDRNHRSLLIPPPFLPLLPDVELQYSWILNAQDVVIFSRRFLVVEKRWRAICESKEEATTAVKLLLQMDPEPASTIIERNNREGSMRGFNIHISQSAQGSDLWLDDPITRHIITLNVNIEEGDEFLLWPLVLNVKGVYTVLILSLVEPQQIKAYMRMCGRFDYGNSAGGKDSLSSLLQQVVPRGRLAMSEVLM